MGITKIDGFDYDTIIMAEMIKAIGHPARLSILKYLVNTPNCICNDIVDELPLAQPTISRHLTELKKVGLIQGNIKGKNICYCINKKNWLKVKAAIDEINTVMNQDQDCC